MTVKDKIKNLFLPSYNRIQAYDQGEGQFVLLYGNLKIGKLTLKEDKWKFCYSEAFKQQDNIQPIADFPQKGKVYTSEVLWPFFASRIPSTATPYVQRKVSKQKININNQKDMLQHFGERTINNPFVLEVIFYNEKN